MNVGQRIKELRKQNNMDQVELAKRLNVSNKTVSSWEQNRTQPKMEMIEAMCDIFHCTKADFVTPEIDYTFVNSDSDFETLISENSSSHLASYADGMTHEMIIQILEIVKKCNFKQLKLIKDFAMLVIENNYLSEKGD